MCNSEATRNCIICPLFYVKKKNRLIRPGKCITNTHLNGEFAELPESVRVKCETGTSWLQKIVKNIDAELLRILPKTCGVATS